MKYAQSKVNPSMNFARDSDALIKLVAWFNDIIILGPSAMVEKAQQKLETEFNYKQEGMLIEYTQSNITVNHDDSILYLGNC